jgi:SAM-dependent methyltransferase
MAENAPEGFDPHITSYYERRPEEHRLSTGIGQLEAHRTRELIGRFAPRPPAVLFDVGGAAGAYAFGFAEEGYEVHLLDPVPRLVELARSANQSAAAPLRSVQVGDARRLPFEDGSADLVLLLGPLYHLQDAQDRAVALSEAARVLRPGGVLFAACITRWASLLDGVVYSFLDDPTFADLVEQDLSTGRHQNPNETPGHFTTAYFHQPGEFVGELEHSGLELLGVFGLEGPARMLLDFDERWADSRRREQILRMVVEVESEPAVWGVSPHLLGVCRRGIDTFG